MNTRKYARTMEEAFGPGHRSGLYTEPEPLNRREKIIAGVVLATAIGSAIVMVLACSLG